MSRNRIGLWLIIHFLFFGAQAQLVEISGTVTDLATSPIPGVTLSIKGTNKGTVTDSQGFFRLAVDSGAVLVIRSIGFDTKEIRIASSKNLQIQLLENTNELAEVVVTALGLERKTKELGYPVQSIKGELVNDVKAANFLDNLSGKLAGVTVSQGATGVGSSSKITIRGESSFTNNNPLFVVDGIPINNNSIVNFTNDAAAGFQEIDFGNGAMEVNPDDVASVSVLKGPGAAALYGSRASNGVIIITTKDGSQSKGIGVSFSSSLFIEQAFQLPEFQNEYGQGNSGEFEFVDGLGGGINDNISYSWGKRLDVGNTASQFDSPVVLPDGTVVRGGDVAVHGGLAIAETPLVAYPDNLKDFYRTGITTINNIAIANAYEKGAFRLSFTDLNSESIIPGVNLDRKTLSARLSFKPTNALSISSSISYVNSQSDNRPSNGYGSENVNYSLVAWGPRSLNINALKDYWQPGLEGIQQYSFNYTFFDNPYFILKENRNGFNRDRVFGNISAQYKITDKLSLTLRSGMDYSSELRTFRRAFSTNRFVNGAYAEHNVFYRENNTDFLLNYHERLERFSFDVSLGGNRLDQNASTNENQAVALAQPGIYNLSNAAVPITSFAFQSQKRVNSLYGVAKFGWRDYLFLEVTGRNDWSSALASPTSTANTSFFYPSVAASYILSNAVRLPSKISFAKLRASWAQVGNDTNPYQTAGVFNAQTPYNSAPTFSAQSTISNANLSPEKTTALEFGTDIRLFEDRIQFDFSYYNAITRDQIMTLPQAISSGFSERVVNGGKVRSEGVEITLGITPILNANFKWQTQLNFSRNITKVLALTDEIETLTLAYSSIYDNVNQTVWYQVEEGGRIGDIYGTGYLKNENGDFVISDEGRFIVDNDLKKLGNYNPDFILGIGNQFQYKRWSGSFLIDWRHGGILVSRTLALGAVGGQLKETAFRPEEGIIADGVINVGTAESPNYQQNTTAIGAESYYRQFYDRNHEENNIYDASYIKLREFSLGYSFDNLNGLLGKNTSLNISLIGRNLFAISDIPHFDPEQLAVQGNQFVSGVEDMSYATTRSYGIKIGLDF